MLKWMQRWDIKIIRSETKTVQSGDVKWQSITFIRPAIVLFVWARLKNDSLSMHNEFTTTMCVRGVNGQIWHEIQLMLRNKTDKSPNNKSAALRQSLALRLNVNSSRLPRRPNNLRAIFLLVVYYSAFIIGCVVRFAVSFPNSHLYFMVRLQPKTVRVNLFGHQRLLTLLLLLLLTAMYIN